MSEESSPKVTLAGATSLKGTTSSIKGSSKPVHSFLGIPFGQPPVGELRFKAPKPAELWEGERQATEYGPVCHQHEATVKMLSAWPMKEFDNMSEDCLYLNVWTPTVDKDAKLPVMVWIYGGGFTCGGSNMYQGNALCSFHDVVVVSINYRVGPLGFLCLDNEEAPGNYGIMDQILALKWVNKYISKFGGNPDNVTIFGESAGGVSCSLLAMTDQTKGLITRAIGQSGTAFLPGLMFTQQKSFDKLKPLLDMEGFTSTNKDEILEFFKKMPAEKMNSLNGGTFSPVIDGKILKGHPLELYKSGQYQKIDFMTGCNSHEGWMMVAFLSKMAGAETIDKIDREVADKMIGMATTDANLTEEKKKALLDQYLPKDVGQEELVKGLTDFMGDVVFAAPAYYEAKLRAKGGGNTFLYHFAYRPSVSMGDKEPDWVTMIHGPDIIYVFGSPFHQGYWTAEFTDEERELSKTIMQYWVQFATDGFASSNISPSWPKFTIGSEECMQLTAESKVDKFPNEERYQIWRDLFE